MPSAQTPQKSLSTISQILSQQLCKNPNPEGYKLCIKDVVKGIEHRTYWYFTAKEAEFLSNVYKKQVDEEALRQRLKQVTDDSINELIGEIQSGAVVKTAVENDSMQVEAKLLQKIQTIAASGSDYYSQNHLAAKQVQQRIKHINDDYQAFKDKIGKVKQRQKEKRQLKQSIESQAILKMKEQKKLQYHKQVMRKMEIMKVKQEQRSLQNQKFKAFIKEYKKSKPLHQLMQEEYKEKFELPQLQESRKKLQLFTGKKKPTLEQINNHERAYMTLKQGRPQRKYIKSHSIDVGYKSHFYKEIQEQDKSQRVDNAYSSMLWDQMQKKKRYSLMVKENYKPKTSRVFHNTLEQNRTLQSASFRKVSPDLSKIKQVGKFYLEYVRSLQKNRTVKNDNEDDQIFTKSGMHQSRYTNYLQDMKTSHEGQGKLRGIGSNWQRDFKDRSSSRSERRDKVLIKSKQLQEQAMRQQTFIKSQRYARPEDIISRKKTVDDTLLESIKAKMALLKDVKDD